MRPDQQKSYRLRRRGAQHLPQRFEIPKGFAHLFAIDEQHVVMHPDPREA